MNAVACALAAAVLLTVRAEGQVTDKKTLTLEGAKSVAAAAATEAQRGKEGASIATAGAGSLGGKTSAAK